jgi:hypothetical protein
MRFQNGSIVITLPPALTIIFYSHKPSEADPIACTIAAGNYAKVGPYSQLLPRGKSQLYYSCSAVSMVITLMRGLTLTILQAQTSKASSIVCTNAAEIMPTII